MSDTPDTPSTDAPKVDIDINEAPANPPPTPSDDE